MAQLCIAKSLESILVRDISDIHGIAQIKYS